jgi:hypothetical protein
MRGLTTAKKQIYDDVYVTKKNPKSTVEKTQQDMAEAQTLLANPDVLEARRKVLMENAQKTGEPVDPFFLLSPDQQKVVLLRDAQAPGSKEASSLASANIDWLKPYWTARSAYFEELKGKGVFKEPSELEGPKFEVNPEMLKLQDSYFALPYGTGQRTSFLKQHPELTEYWDEKRQYTNEVRVSMGLPPIESGNYGSSWPKAKPKIAKAKALKYSKAPKIKVTSVANFKALKPMKRKSLKNIQAKKYLS